MTVLCVSIIPPNGSTDRANGQNIKVRGIAEIEVVSGSVLDQDVHAIVNAANTSMRGGGGLDGAVHRAAGAELIRYLEQVAPHGAKTGEVVVTPAFQLKQRYIFHTAGPVWWGGFKGEAELLAACYRNCLAEAEARPDVESIAFCSISTGLYKFPIDLAASIAIGEAKEHVQSDSSLRIVRFALFTDKEYRFFQTAFERR